MSKISPQTKTFIALLCFAVVGAYVCLMLWSNSVGNISNKPGDNTNTVTKNNSSAAVASAATVPPVDTSGWKSYSNKQEQLSFLYKPDWKVLPAVKKGGFTVLQVDPGTRYYNIKIYISPKEFYVLDGLPATTETIGGQTALNIGNALYGITANNLYYTFDVGMSMSLVPDFNALVHSVKFGN
jgi:hypothetical protein